jgi:hypothetical protein
MFARLHTPMRSIRYTAFRAPTLGEIRIEIDTPR